MEGKEAVDMTVKEEDAVVKVRLPRDTEVALSKLALLKGCKKSEVVALAVDLILPRPSEEIVTMVRQRREAR